MEKNENLISDFHFLDISICSQIWEIGTGLPVQICCPLHVSFSQLPACTSVWAQMQAYGFYIVDTFNSVTFCDELCLKVTESTYLIA